MIKIEEIRQNFTTAITSIQVSLSEWLEKIQIFANKHFSFLSSDYASYTSVPSNNDTSLKEKITSTTNFVQKLETQRSDVTSEQKQELAEKILEIEQILDPFNGNKAQTTGAKNQEIDDLAEFQLKIISKLRQGDLKPLETALKKLANKTSSNQSNVFSPTEVPVESSTELLNKSMKELPVSSGIEIAAEKRKNQIIHLENQIKQKKYAIEEKQILIRANELSIEKKLKDIKVEINDLRENKQKASGTEKAQREEKVEKAQEELSNLVQQKKLLEEAKQKLIDERDAAEMNLKSQKEAFVMVYGRL